MAPKRSIHLLTTLVLLSSSLLLSSASAAQGEAIRILSPARSSEVITKHPDIQGVFITPVDQQSLLILLDDNDISATVEFTDNGFRCQVPIILPAGKHILYIAGNSDDGPFEQEMEFSSRHYTLLDEASTSNEWTMNLQAGNVSSNKQNDYIPADLDSTLSHQSYARKGNWEVSLSGNIRLLEQHNSGQAQYSYSESDTQDYYAQDDQDSYALAENQGSLDPERQGLDVNTVLLRTQYQNERTRTVFELGDLQVEGSNNTFGSLARNGGQLILDYNNISFQGFSVFGSDTFGIRDGFGIGFDNDKYLYGGSAAIRLLQDTIHLKAFYMDGGQQDNVYSSWALEQGNQGSVYGFVLKTNLFDDSHTAEFEYDISDFDPNTSDEFGSEHDDAYRVQFGGQLDQYGYDIAWEHFSPAYDIPGNLSPKKDYEGVTANGYAQYDVQSISIMLAAYRDNVESDPLYARINSLSGQLDYQYNGFTEFPLGLSYQHTSDRSRHEPLYSPETHLNTDMFTGNIGYLSQGSFSIDFSSSYTWQDDKSIQDADIATLNFMITPGLTFDYFSLYISGGLNQNRDFLSHNRTDDYTVTLDGMGTLFEELLSYEFGGTYLRSLMTDDIGDYYGSTGYGRLAWNLPWFTDTVRTSLGVELQYSNTKEMEGSRTEETRVFCTLSTSVPFSF